MSDVTADSDPRGFSILMPEGWSRYRVDDEGRTQFRARAAARMKALGRPDLDVQIRMLVNEQWRELERTRALAVYLPDRETSAWRPPVSIAARKVAAPQGSHFEAAVRERFGALPERLDTPLGQVLRWRSSQRGSGELSELHSVTLGYAFPAPVPDPRVGLAFIAVLPHPDDVVEQTIEGAVELIDTIMETFRWR